jgi:hypothetical protein
VWALFKIACIVDWFVGEVSDEPVRFDGDHFIASTIILRSVFVSCFIPRGRISAGGRQQTRNDKTQFRLRHGEIQSEVADLRE